MLNSSRCGTQELTDVGRKLMHYSRVMPPTGDHRYFTSTAVFINELLKLSFSLTLCIYEASRLLAPSTPATVLFQQISNNVFSADAWKLAIPAALYTIQNLLQYMAVSNLSAVHFQILYQLKVGSWFVFSRRGLPPGPLTGRRSTRSSPLQSLVFSSCAVQSAPRDGLRSSC